MPEIKEDGQQDQGKKESHHDAKGRHHAEDLNRHQFRSGQGQNAGHGGDRCHHDGQACLAVGFGQGIVVVIALASEAEIGAHHVNAISNPDGKHQQHGQGNHL